MSPSSPPRAARAKAHQPVQGTLCQPLPGRGHPPVPPELPPELQAPLQRGHPGGAEAMACAEKSLYRQGPPKTGQGPCRQRAHSVNLKGPSRHGTHVATLLLSSPFSGAPKTNRFLHPWGAHRSCPSCPRQPPHGPSLPPALCPAALTAAAGRSNGARSQSLCRGGGSVPVHQFNLSRSQRLCLK